MGQKLNTRSFRNHGEECGKGDAADANGVAEPQPIGALGSFGDGFAQADIGEVRRARRGHLRPVTTSADRDAGSRVGVGLDRVRRLRPVRSPSPSPPTRVLIADAHALVRAGYRALLESDAGIEVVAEAASSQQALALATRTAPDVALLDPALPGLEDLEAASAIMSHPAFAGVAVVLTASWDDDQRVFSALRAGAVGVLQKDDEPTTLIDSVRMLARGQALLPASTVSRLLGGLRPRSPRRARLTPEMEELTDREREVVALAAEGLTNGEIAARLVISPATAKTHVSRAMIKLRVRHRAELVVSAYENGLVVPPERSSTGLSSLTPAMATL